MSVIRQRRRTNFTVVDNSSITDTRLSLRAKGLHVVLLSKPDHWEFSAERLGTECREGRDAIRAALRELKECGYVLEIREQGAGGFWTTVTEVREVPDGDVPVSPSGRAGVEVRSLVPTDRLTIRQSDDRVLGEPSDGGSGHKSKDGEAKTESKKTMPAASRAGRTAKRKPDPDDEVERVGGDTEPQAEVHDIAAPRKQGIYGLAADFKRMGQSHYPLGDSRRVCNLTALRVNISRWHKQDGLPLEDISNAIDIFWAGVDSYVRPDSEPWRRFINIFARVYAKATAPDITDPAYYTDSHEKENIEWTAEAWLASQGVAASPSSVGS